jgi:nucleotide-binding universal stress UspA family protein
MGKDDFFSKNGTVQQQCESMPKLTVTFLPGLRYSKRLLNATIMTSPIRKILVPTDFSTLSACCLHFGERLAGQSGASILLLHVVEQDNHHTLSSTGEIQRDPMEDVFTLKMLEKSRYQLADMAEKEMDSRIPVHYQVLVGNPAEQIIQAVQDTAADLVVIGASGAGWLDRLLVGSTTEQVVQAAACPVITLKCSIGKDTPLRHIVFAPDPEEDQTGVIEELKKLQKLLDACLHVVVINTPDAFESSKVLAERLRHFVATYGLENTTTHIYDELNAEDGLYGFANEIDADVLAFSSHRQSRLLRVLSPHSTQNIVNHSTRPVWTFNPAMAAAKEKTEEDGYNCAL